MMDLEDTKLRFIKGERYALLDDYAIVGDVHLGFEEKFNEEGYNVPLFSKKIEKRLLSISSKKLIMLGDVKEGISFLSLHKRDSIRNFFKDISARFDETIITKGNHDANIERLLHDIPNIKVVREFLYGDILFLHGHRLPDKTDIKAASTICSAHLHPTIKMVDANGVVYYDDCWLLFDLFLPREKFGDNNVKNGVVFPSFNELIGHMEKVRDVGFMKYARNIQRLTIDLALLPEKQHL